MRKIIPLILAATSFQILIISKANATIIYPIVFCHDTDIVYNCETEQYFDGWYALHIPSNYVGDIIKIRFQGAIQGCIAYSFGAFPELTDIGNVGNPCYITSSFTDSITISYPSGTCSSGGYGEFHIHVVFTPPPSNCPLIFKLYNLVYPNPCDSVPILCEDCLPSFSPQPDSTYILSAWVSESPYPTSTTTFSEPVIKISYAGSGQTEEFHASGQIIDGWQRVEGVFTVPHTATLFNLILEPGGITGWFDDIRIYPQRGSMKTYVFDPVNLRLDAELDERNYATIYEYDEEGHLTRVKKETERGIMTIQENKTATAK